MLGWHSAPPFLACLCWQAFLVAVCTIPATRAADPQPYSVTLKPTGDKPLDTALHDASMLVSLEKKAPVGGFALVERAREDDEPLADRVCTASATTRRA